MSKTRENINVVEKISYSSHTITSQFAPSAMHCNNPVVNQLPQDIGLLHVRFSSLALSSAISPIYIVTYASWFSN